MSVPKIGYTKGVCPSCGKTLIHKRPTDMAVCDCYKYCPLCGNKMASFNPDLTPKMYGAEEGFALKGQTVESSGWSIETVYVCYNHSPPHYSTQKPVEVRLS